MKTKNNYIAGFLIGFVGVLLLGGLFFYASTLAVNKPSGFNPRQKVAAGVIYDRLTAIDYTNDYPDLPETVMDAYCDTVVLLYSNFIEDEALYSEIIALQRQFYDEELLEKNTQEEQIEAFLAAKAELERNGAFTVSVEHDNTYYYTEGEKYCASIQVTQYIQKLGMAYWNYYLEDQDGRWKITSWAMTDDKFNVIQTD